MSSRFLTFFIIGFLMLAFFGWRVVNPNPSGKDSGKRVQIYFFKGESLRSVSRTITGNEGRLQFAFDQLFLGPTQQELQDGYFTQIPKTLVYKDVRISPSLATIIFDDTFKEVSGGTAKINGMLAQIVYTATQFSSVNYLNFELENKQYPIIIGGEGITIDQPLNKQDYKEFE